MADNIARYEEQLEQANEKFVNLEIEIAKLKDEFEAAQLAEGFEQTALPDDLVDLPESASAEAKAAHQADKDTLAHASEQFRQIRLAVFARLQQNHKDSADKSTASRKRKSDDDDENKNLPEPMDTTNLPTGAAGSGGDGGAAGTDGGASKVDGNPNNGPKTEAEPNPAQKVADRNQAAAEADKAKEAEVLEQKAEDERRRAAAVLSAAAKIKASKEARADADKDKENAPPP